MEAASSTFPIESFHSFVSNIHVLLVDNDRESLTSVDMVLQSLSYKVTTTDSSLGARKLLSHGKVKFDIIVSDIRLAEADEALLLYDAVTIYELPTVLMSAFDDATLAKMHLETGVCFFLEKPIPPFGLKNLWQFVVKDRARKNQRNGSIAPNHHGILSRVNETPENSPRETSETDNEPHPSANSASRRDQISNKRTRSSNDQCIINLDEEAAEEEGNASLRNRRSETRKPPAEWTDELHSMFMAAVNQLGEGKCYPKHILKLMNVPNLTRLQIASHLQKCRNQNWRLPDERKQPNNSPSRHYLRKFGSVPPQSLVGPLSLPTYQFYPHASPSNAPQLGHRSPSNFPSMSGIGNNRQLIGLNTAFPALAPRDMRGHYVNTTSAPATIAAATPTFGGSLGHYVNTASTPAPGGMLGHYVNTASTSPAVAPAFGDTIGHYVNLTLTPISGDMLGYYVNTASAPVAGAPTLGDMLGHYVNMASAPTAAARSSAPAPRDILSHYVNTAPAPTHALGDMLGHCVNLASTPIVEVPAPAAPSLGDALGHYVNMASAPTAAALGSALAPEDTLDHYVNMATAPAAATLASAPAPEDMLSHHVNTASVLAATTAPATGDTLGHHVNAASSHNVGASDQSSSLEMTSSFQTSAALAENNAAQCADANLLSDDDLLFFLFNGDK